MVAGLTPGLLIPLQAGAEAELASWQLALIAFGFIVWILVVAALLERWEVGLHA